MTARYIKTVDVLPWQTGFNAKTMAASADGSWIDVNGFASITFFVKYTYNAGTAVTWQVKATNDKGTTVFEVPLAENAGSGGANYYEFTGTFPISAASRNFCIPLDVADHAWIKLDDVTVTGGGASDILTISARKSTAAVGG